METPRGRGLEHGSGLVVVALILGLTIHSTHIGAYAAALENSLQREMQQKREADLQRRFAEGRELAARQQAYASEMGRAWRMWQSGQGLALCELLNHHRPEQNQVDIRGFEWHYLWSLGCNASQLRGHVSGAQRLRFSADGTLCTTWTDGLIHIWHVPTRRLRTMLTADEPIYDARFSPDGSQIVCICGLGTIQVWNVVTGEKRSSREGPRLQPPVPELHSIVNISPDGTEFAYTTIDKRDTGDVFCAWHIWDLVTEKSRRLPPLAAPISKSGQYSGDGTKIAIESHSLTEDRIVVQIFDAVSGELKKTLDYPPFKVAKDFGFSAADRTVFVGTWSGSAVLLDLETGQTTHHQLAHPETHVSFDKSSDGLTFAAGFCNRSELPDADHILLWRGDPTNILAKPTTSGFGVNSLAFSPDGRILAYVGERGLFRFWSVEQYPEFVSFDAHNKEAWCVTFAPHGGLLASASDDHTVKLWDARTGEEKMTLGGHAALVSAVTFSPDGRTLATSSFDKTIKVWEVSSGKNLRTLPGHQGPIRSLAFHAEGELVTSISDDQTVRTWDVRAGTLSRTLHGHEDKIRAIVCDINSSFFITADNDGVINLWDTNTSSMVQSWRVAHEVHSLALTRDCKLLAVGSKEGLIRLYSVPGIQPLNVLEGTEGGARCLAFSADGRTLASGGEDQAVTLWHVATGQQLLSLPGIKSQVNSLAFSADGQTLAAATHDGAVKLWRAFNAEASSDNP